MHVRSDAERMASQHRQANISEYFDRNIAQLGFNSKQKALVTAVKEGVDNALRCVRGVLILLQPVGPDHPHG